MPEDDVWYYEKDGQQYGPVSHAELQRLIESGFISRHNLAWRPGEKDWSASGSFQDLAAAFPTATPVKKPPPPPPQTTPPQAPQPPPPPQPEQPQQPDETEQPKAGPPWYKRLASGISWIWNLLTKINAFFDGRPGRVWVAIILALVAPTYIVIETRIIEPAREEKRQLAEAQATPTSLSGTRVPVGYKGPVGQIKIDAYPWAQVSRLSSGETGDLAIPGGQATPLVLLVAPGSYRIEFDSGTASCDVLVAKEQSRSCQRILRTVHSATYYQEIGW